jgi:hypothetical protein
MKGWWNVIYLKLKCAAFVLKLEKTWYTYFSTALMSVLFGFRLHIAYKQSVILTLLYHKKYVYLVYSLVLFQYIEYINTGSYS